MTAVLIDTNVLVYAHDRGEPKKQAQAIKVLNYLQVTGQGRLSVQCLSEFFSIITRGKQPKLARDAAAQQVERLAHSFPVYDLTPLIVIEATRGARDHSLAYYDAQIWAAARLNQIPVVFSEDFSAGSTLEGVQFVNPFAADFVLETWA
ncbi:MAG TPA: PIN domain-containing protein [Anaerolineae bacterium]|nr:PIN domain-containing protein [Anaerolineae bacterium]